jgi:putative endonuclease
MFHVYVLKSEKDKNIYTGYTSNLKLRLLEHDRGEVDSTRNRRPLKLVYYETFLSKIDAEKREKYLKSGGKAKNDLKLQIGNSLKI